MTNATQEIITRLRRIEGELAYLKENVATKEVFLTSEEKQLLAESYAAERNGTLMKSRDARRLLGV